MNGWKDCGPHPFLAGMTVYRKNSLTAICGREENGLFHLSLTAHKRNPAYTEIKQARYDLCPAEAHMAMIFPPENEFVNLHTGCFHLFELARGEVE